MPLPYLSIVSPVYRAEKLLPELVQRIATSASTITTDYEIILVEDGGPDNSWSVIESLARTHEKVKGIKLSRNFGQHYAISAGLDQASGNWVVVMDCDLQDQPEEIPKLYSVAQTGYDIVFASRKARKDRFGKKALSVLFYKTLSYLTGTEHDSSIANFGIYNQRVISAINSMPESIRYFPTMVKWVGFKSTSIEVQHNARPEGESSYNVKKLLQLATDIILAYSDKPIRIVVKTGIAISAISFAIATYYAFRWLVGDILVLGYTSLIISIWLLSGIIISTLGITGLYIGKTFEGVKNRPIYIIAQKTDSTLEIHNKDASSE